MSFRLFGVDVEVKILFWITALLLGLNQGLELTQPAPLLVWILVVFVSILVHEFGHAAAILRHRLEPQISLHFMGGTTTWRALLPLRRLDLVIISLAGPFAQFALAGLIWGFSRVAPGVVNHLPGLA